MTKMSHSREHWVRGHGYNQESSMVKISLSPERSAKLAWVDFAPCPVGKRVSFSEEDPIRKE